MRVPNSKCRKPQKIEIKRRAQKKSLKFGEGNGKLRKYGPNKRN